MDPAAATEHPLPGRRMGSTCLSRCPRVGTASRWVGWRVVGDRGRTYAPRTAMSSRSLRSVPSGLGENAVAAPKVRPRRRQRCRSGERGRTGSGGRRGCGAEDVQGCGARGVGGWAAARGGWVCRARAGRHPSVDGPHRGTQVTQWTRVGQYARLWWESQGTRADRRGVLDVGRVR